MQHQSAIIQNLQQQQANRGAGNGGPGNEEPRVEENPIEGGHGPERGPQPVIARQEPLYQRFSNMKPKEFEGSSNPLDAEEWLSSIQLIMEFMELNDRERVSVPLSCSRGKPDTGGTPLRHGGM